MIITTFDIERNLNNNFLTKFFDYTKNILPGYQKTMVPDIVSMVRCWLNRRPAVSHSEI